MREDTEISKHSRVFRAPGRYFLANCKRLAAVLLCASQVTALPRDDAQIAQSTRLTEAAGSKLLTDGERLLKEILCLGQSATSARQNSQLIKSVGHIQTSRYQPLLGRESLPEILLRPPQIAATMSD